MKTYIGTKQIEAEPCSNAEAVKLGIAKPHKEESGYRVRYSDGYESWSPSNPFEQAYRENGNLTFGDAVKALKDGHRVSRSGWNGKGMFLWLLPKAEIKKEWIKDPQFSEVADEIAPGSDSVLALGSIRMFTKDSTGREAVLTGWLASQSDMLEEDWMILE